MKKLPALLAAILFASTQAVHAQPCAGGAPPAGNRCGEADGRKSAPCEKADATTKSRETGTKPAKDVVRPDPKCARAGHRPIWSACR